MSLLQTLLRPDHDDNPDRARSARAANLLQVGEFQLVQLAYFEWFGEDLPEALGHRVFNAYMLRDQVPPWVRHYTRRILALDEAGQLDDRDPAYHRYDPASLRPGDVRMWRFVIVSAAVAFCVLGAFGLSFELAGKATSVLPPYFSDEELGGGH